ncbi:hypothetical protein M011DRAFT_110935 [Sporormia fimetaria CBS 119925]|uniref:Uncharacterized protein n=1 Tax=Sporormia fimetaria CBS 119925 TaxID=1340428 RepID=A0A6A6VPW8_9PLEO|nr:hypothetical protein M011DRAFT_110935 [Sporormia fimetaria CBS 119925]
MLTVPLYLEPRWWPGAHKVRGSRWRRAGIAWLGRGGREMNGCACKSCIPQAGKYSTPFLLKCSSDIVLQSIEDVIVFCVLLLRTIFHFSPLSTCSLSQYGTALRTYYVGRYMHRKASAHKPWNGNCHPLCHHKKSLCSSFPSAPPPPLSSAPSEAHSMDGAELPSPDAEDVDGIQDAGPALL